MIRTIGRTPVERTTTYKVRKVFEAPDSEERLPLERMPVFASTPESINAFGHGILTLMEGSSAIRAANTNDAGITAPSLTLDSSGRTARICGHRWPMLSRPFGWFLIAPFAFFMAHGDKRYAEFALITYIVALATDFADGPIARRLGTVSAIGGTFDHTVIFCL